MDDFDLEGGRRRREKRHRGDSNQGPKRPVWPHQPILYLEPKWLRCWVAVLDGKGGFWWYRAQGIHESEF